MLTLGTPCSLTQPATNPTQAALEQPNQPTRASSPAPCRCRCPGLLDRHPQVQVQASASAAESAAIMSSYQRRSAHPHPPRPPPQPAGPVQSYGPPPPWGQPPPPPAGPPMPPAAPVKPAAAATGGGRGVRHDEAEWVLTLDQVYRQSPSQRDGLDDATERRHRREGCRLAEEMALKLDMCVPCVGGAHANGPFQSSGAHLTFDLICEIRRGRVAATTALVFFHRFYTRNSFKHHDRYVRTCIYKPHTTRFARSATRVSPSHSASLHPTPHHPPSSTLTSLAHTAGHGRRRGAAGREGGGARPEAQGRGAQLPDAAAGRRGGKPKQRGEDAGRGK